MLAAGETRRLERFPLGPSLGQCCGGVVQLAFELLDRAHDGDAGARPMKTAGAWSRWTARPTWRCSTPWRIHGGEAPDFSRPWHPGFTHIMREPTAGAGWWIKSQRRAPHLMLFGAGHVGAAIVRALAELPCRVTWVDEREDLFPNRCRPT
jgi:xanthine dehydrogenase accessory factor